MAKNLIQKEAASFERAVGRRKTSSARVRLHPNGSGAITVNDKPFKIYFPKAFNQQTVLAPLKSVGKESGFDVTVRVVGGGHMSQAQAVRHGIARALVRWNEDFKPVLRAEGFLTRDARVKERKKSGLRRARRGRQWRKR
ncbi:MAG: 30S ribosomal protein S9 [Candidatus Magasanikbacteria bacterium]|nr:30S ribosomal protein S9 [Candidatus Magasanikbacteria bacterium]